MRLLDLLRNKVLLQIAYFNCKFAIIFRLIRRINLKILSNFRSKISNFRDKPYYATGLIKRMFDMAVVSVALVITAPLFLIIAALIKIDSGGRVFFIQERAGKNGKPFKFLKFRTMVENAEQIGLGKLAAENDPRITRVGKFLRKWTLDELPQFINILQGEMSFVGPRPLPMYQVQQYNDFQKRRLEVLPGLISIVDIKGRNLVPWDKRFEYDAWYVDHQSLWLDIKIFFVGFFAVLSRRGVYGEGGINKPPE